MDKYKAVWLSHSSIADFLKCPRSYYLRNVYKDPQTGHKITVMTPPLALGAIVHEVLEGLSNKKVEERFLNPLSDYFELGWQKVRGEKGGFKNIDEENEYKNKGLEMLLRVEKNPGILKNMAIKIKSESGLPFYWLSEDDNLILCGKIDWIEYLDEENIHLLDFKTGKNDEDEDSLQLPIYLLLAKNLQKRKVKKASYWYLNKEGGLIEKILPSVDESFEKVYEIGKRIKLARQINHFKCPTNGCFKCKPLERILKGEGRKVSTSEYNQDVYIL